MERCAAWAGEPGFTATGVSEVVATEAGGCTSTKYQAPAATRRSKAAPRIASGASEERRFASGGISRGFVFVAGFARAGVQRIDPDRFGDVLEIFRAEVGHGQIEPPFHLTIGVLGKTDRAGRGDAFEARGDVDAVAHQVAVALLDHVAEMDADTKFDALFRRDLGVALDHRSLEFNGAVHCVHDAAEFDDAAVARALDDAAVMHCDGRVDQVAPQGPKAGEDSILIRTRKPRIADDVGHQDRRELSSLAHGASAEARSPVTGGMGMAALPCCTEGTWKRECSPACRLAGLSTPC